GQGAVKKPDSVIAPSRDRVQVEYQVATYFKLNIGLLRQFHEQLGLRYRAYTAKGWANLLSDTLRQQIEAALQQETGKYDVADLFGSAPRLNAVQKAVQSSLRSNLQESLGAPFFCGPTYSTTSKACPDLVFLIKKIDIPKSVSSAYESNRTSQV